MKIAVLMKEIVDLVEEISVLDDSSDLERDYLMFRSNEFDDAALEESLQLKKENHSVDVYALDGSESDALLHMALARGADTLHKVTFENYNIANGIPSRVAAHAFYEAIKDKNYDLVLTGVQGIDDLDGPISGHLSQLMGAAHLSVIVQVDSDGDGKIKCMKEFPAGVVGEYSVKLPAVLGIQASRSPPSYIPVSKIRKMASEATINEISVGLAEVNLSKIQSYSLPESGDRATMLEGEIEDQVSKLIEILASKGIL